MTEQEEQEDDQAFRTDLPRKLRALAHYFPIYAFTCEYAADEIERLQLAGHNAFLAMCAQRDSPDEEVFQDAIDALGVALLNNRKDDPDAA